MCSINGRSLRWTYVRTCEQALEVQGCTCEQHERSARDAAEARGARHGGGAGEVPAAVATILSFGGTCIGRASLEASSAVSRAAGRALSR